MDAAGWRKIIRQSCKNDVILDLLARELERLDMSKQLLREKGYGQIGLNIYETVLLVPSAKDNDS